MQLKSQSKAEIENVDSKDLWRFQDFYNNKYKCTYEHMPETAGFSEITDFYFFKIIFVGL